MKKASAHVVHHSRLIAFVLALLLAFPISSFHSAEEDIPEARHAWMGGYQAMNKADKAMEEHSELAALHDYQKALEIFQKVQRDYPRWNVSLLRFRVDYCRKQIEALKASNAHNLDFMTKEELLATVNRQTEDLQAMREQNALLTRNLQTAQASLESARAEAAKAAVSQENLLLLRQDRETLNAQVKLLTAQLTTAKEELQKTRTELGADKFAETERQLTAIRKELEEVTRQLDAAQKEKKQLGNRISQYDKQRQVMEERLAAAEKSAATAKKSMDSQAAENRQLQQEVARLRGNIAKDSTTVNGELPQLQAQLRNREEELRSAQMEVMTLKRKLTQAEESASALGADLENQNKRLQSDGALLNEKIAQVETLTAAKEKLEAQLQESAATLASHKELLAKLESAAAQAERQLAEYKSSSSNLEEKLHSTEASLKQTRHLSEAADGITANALTMEQELQKARAEKALLEATNKTLEERIELLGNGETNNTKLHEQSIRDLEEITGLRIKAARLEQRLNESNAACKDAQEKLNALTAAADGPQRSLQELQIELDKTKRKLQESSDENTVYNDLLAAKARLAELEKASLETPEKLRQTLRRNADDLESLWSKRLKEAESRMNAEVAKRQELEAALIKSDSARQALEQEVLRNKGTSGEATDNTLLIAGNRTQDGSAAFASSVAQSATPLSLTDEIIMKGYLRQGVDAERKGNQETAQWNYEQALKMQPDNPVALKRLGLIAANRGDDQTAANYLGQAFRLTPDDHEVLMGLGFAMIQLNQPLWALAGLSRAAALRPNDPEVMRLFGIALSTMRWQEAAEVQFKRTLQLKKDDAEAAFNLAMLELARSSELRQQARQDQNARVAMEALAAARRAQALKWYKQAIDNGAQPDPELERALAAAPEKK